MVKKSLDRHAKSKAAFARASTLMPGGVNSPVRAYKAVGMSPVFVKQAKGCRVTDLDGHTYVDYVMSYGPLILGHAPDVVLAAISKAARKGTSFGMPTEAESDLAQLIVHALPAVEMIRFVSSGTEAAMSAIRLARTATGRSKIIKCIGCYHGHADALLVQAGSGATTLGTPSSPGVPESITAHTLLVPYNDLAAVEKALLEHPGQVAAMCVEPVAGNMGCVPPEPGYLQGLRDLCTQHGTLLLFDEVMTGFRLAWGGAQLLYGVQPDLVCLGKVIGGGLPCAAYGGREPYMRLVSPDGPMYQAGTLSGNPLAMSAGLATLEALRDGTVYREIEDAASVLEAGLRGKADMAGVPIRVQRVGSMLTLFFVKQDGDQVHHYQEALGCDTQKFAVFFRGMLERGVILPPSQYEAWFVSSAHDSESIEHTIDAAGDALDEVARS